MSDHITASEAQLYVEIGYTISWVSLRRPFSVALESPGVGSIVYVPVREAAALPDEFWRKACAPSEWALFRDTTRSMQDSLGAFPMEDNA